MTESRLSLNRPHKSCADRFEHAAHDEDATTDDRKRTKRDVSMTQQVRCDTYEDDAAEDIEPPGAISRDGHETKNQIQNADHDAK